MDPFLGKLLFSTRFPSEKPSHNPRYNLFPSGKSGPVAFLKQENHWKKLSGFSSCVNIPHCFQVPVLLGNQLPPALILLHVLCTCGTEIVKHPHVAEQVHKILGGSLPGRLTGYAPYCIVSFLLRLEYQVKARLGFSLAGVGFIR